MRVQARLILGVFSLVLAVPGWMAAARAGDDAQGPASVAADTVDSGLAEHKHKGLFGWRHCLICQRMQAKKQYGIDIPAPPSADPVTGMISTPAPMSASAHMHAAGSMAASCPTCQGGTMMTDSAPVAGHSHAPGYAVVGGPAGMIDPNAPGYAVVGGGMPMGADPAPIGIAHGPQMPGGFDPRMAAVNRRPGSSPYDPAVTQSSLPPGQVALSGPGHDRPHIIGHLFGIPKFGTRRRAEEDKERQKHAAIAYDDTKAPVTELPASMVYGSKNDH